MLVYKVKNINRILKTTIINTRFSQKVSSEEKLAIENNIKSLENLKNLGFTVYTHEEVILYNNTLFLVISFI